MRAPALQGLPWDEMAPLLGRLGLQRFTSQKHQGIWRQSTTAVSRAPGKDTQSYWGPTSLKASVTLAGWRSCQPDSLTLCHLLLCSHAPSEVEGAEREQAAGKPGLGQRFHVLTLQGTENLLSPAIP